MNLIHTKKNYLEVELKYLNSETWLKVCNAAVDNILIKKY